MTHPEVTGQRLTVGFSGRLWMMPPRDDDALKHKPRDPCASLLKGSSRGRTGHRPLYRLQTTRRSFWDDRAWVPLKMILLAALVVAAALL